MDMHNVSTHAAVLIHFHGSCSFFYMLTMFNFVKITEVSTSSTECCSGSQFAREYEKYMLCRYPCWLLS